MSAAGAGIRNPVDALEQARRRREEVDTLEAIAICQLADLEELKSKSKGKGKEDGPSTDADEAVRLFEEELEQILSALRDAKIAQSMYTAGVTDDAELEALARAEEVAQRDRALALKLAGLSLNSTTTASTPRQVLSTSSVASTSASRIASTSTASWRDRAAARASGSGSAAKTELKASVVDPKNLPNCVICTERVEAGPNQYIQVGCNHSYCRDCIKELFSIACRDETLFPPRCCRQVIDPESVRELLGDELSQHFKKKSIELSVKDRLYCYEPSCGTFIGEAVPVTTDVNNAASTAALQRECPTCGRKACAACKGPAHIERDSVCRRDQDKDSQAVLALAREEGWQRCPVCSHMVALKEGCHHMTCICRAEFCYVCNGKWPTRRSTCDNGCALFSEARLQAQAAAQVRAQGAAYNQPIGVVALAAARRHILEHHDCRHTRGFRYKEPGGRCHECRYNLRYLFACNACNVAMCNRCRRNRLY